MPTTQELIDELPDTGDIVPGVTTGHVGDHGAIKQVLQDLLNLIEAIPDGGGGGGGGGDGTDPLAVHSPDSSWLNGYIVSKAAYDAIASPADGDVYLTYPEA